MIVPSQQQMMGGLGGRFGPIQTFGQDAHADYYDDAEGEYDDEDAEAFEMFQGQQRAGGKVLTPDQERAVLRDLSNSAQRNPEFIKVLNILANDPELRPLIFEHESLLKALKDMTELKAEQMLSILTAAETEMFETSQKQESQQMEKSQTFKSQELRQAHESSQTSAELDQLRDKVASLDREKSELKKHLDDAKVELAQR